MPAAIWFFAQGIATLDDKTGDDSVKSRAIIKPHFGKLEEIIQMTRSVFGIKANFDLAEFGRDGDPRVDFLEFHSHGCKSIKGAGREAMDRWRLPLALYLDRS